MDLIFLHVQKISYKTSLKEKKFILLKILRELKCSNLKHFLTVFPGSSLTIFVSKFTDDYHNQYMIHKLWINHNACMIHNLCGGRNLKILHSTRSFEFWFQSWSKIKFLSFLKNFDAGSRKFDANTLLIGPLINKWNRSGNCL